MGPGRRGALAADMAAFSEETTSDVLPMRVIFFDTRAVRAKFGSLNGGFWRPCFVTRNF